MPDKTPKGPKVKGVNKKYAVPAVIIVGIALALYLKKKKAVEPSSVSGTEPGTQGLSNQSFIPVTGENVAGVGASGGGTTESSNNTQLLTEIIRGDRESTQEQNVQNQDFIKSIVEGLRVGGGAPTETAPVGVVAAPPQGGATPPPSSPSSPAKPPAPSSPSYTVIKCGNGCQGHRYKSGKVECQVRNAKHACVWP